MTEARPGARRSAWRGNELHLHVRLVDAFPLRDRVAVAHGRAKLVDAFAAVLGLQKIVPVTRGHQLQLDIRPVLEILRADPDLYVRKSVANVLRNASKRHPAFVLNLCRRWARVGHPQTDWIIKDGLRKLRESDPEPVEQILNSLGHASA